MAKQIVTESCEYVRRYPFQLLQGVEFDDGTTRVFVATGTGASARGKLPFASRRPSYVQEFADQNLTICIQFPPLPLRLFAFAKGYMLRAPVKLPSSPNGEDTLTTTHAVFINVTFRVLITGSFGNCDCFTGILFFMIVGGTGGGTFDTGILTCTSGLGSLCGTTHAEPCEAIMGDYNGSVQLDWTGTTTVTPDDPSEGITHTRHLITPGTRTLNVTNGLTNVMTTQANVNTLNTGVGACQAAFPPLVIQGTVTAVHSSGNDIIDSNWEDDLIDEGGGVFTWNGWTVVNPP